MQNEKKLSMRQKFVRFLMKRGLLSKFYTYLRILNPGINQEELKEVLFNRNPKDWLSSAFSWKMTNKGYDFWLRIHKEWVRYIRDDIN